jgi:hypothetical protein
VISRSVAVDLRAAIPPTIPNCKTFGVMKNVTIRVK